MHNCKFTNLFLLIFDFYVIIILTNIGDEFMIKKFKTNLRNIIKNTDKPLLMLSILLFSLGLIMIFSSSNVTAFMKYSASPYQYFIKQGLFLLISISLSCGLIFFPSNSYNFCSKLLLLIFVPVLFLLLLYGSVKNQAVSWIDLGFMSLQPSEFIKIITIMYLSCFYNRNQGKLDNPLTCLRSLIIPLIVAALIFFQPDLGTMIIYAGIVASLFFLSKISTGIKKKVFITGALFIGAVIILIVTGGKEVLKSRQLQRIDVFDPCSEEKFYSTGNQVCNGFIAINNGGLKGLGLGNSTQKYLYLPEAHTDFIFPIIVEETGIAGAFILFALYFLLIGRILKIAKESYNERGKLICYGVAIYILIHIIVNLGGVLGLIPMTGVPLPFMSYGGSYLMCLVLALMLVQRINIENNNYKEKPPKKARS